MGSRVIRFPFILHTSYPHEILHNWWGNGVYVNRQGGNWSEGLTAYLSDHLFPDLNGKGDRYRFQELMKYASYVNAKNDFSLSQFKGRTNMASQAIGYGKLVMVLNMLRLELGDKVFLKPCANFSSPRNSVMLDSTHCADISKRSPAKSWTSFSGNGCAPGERRSWSWPMPRMKISRTNTGSL